MRIRRFLTGLVLATLLAWVCLFAILKYFDPFDQSYGVFAFFYLSFLFSVFGTFSLIDFLVRRITQKAKSEKSHIKIALRQGILLSLIVILSLYFLQKEILFWWSLLPLILIFVILEWLLSKVKYVN